MRLAEKSVSGGGDQRVDGYLGGVTDGPGGLGAPAGATPHNYCNYLGGEKEEAACAPVTDMP